MLIGEDVELLGFTKCGSSRFHQIGPQMCSEGRIILPEGRPLEERHRYEAGEYVSSLACQDTTIKCILMDVMAAFILGLHL